MKFQKCNIRTKIVLKWPLVYTFRELECDKIYSKKCNKTVEDGSIRGIIQFLSNSLIIHKEKTKEIPTVTLDWIPDLN